MCILSLVAYNSSAQTLEFTKEGAVAEEQFGSATKISGNGQFLVVGSPQYKPDKFGVKGKISIYKKNNDGNWEQAQEIVGNDGLFGSALAISENGQTIAVGAKLLNSLKGQVITYAFNGTIWAAKGSAIDGGTGELLGTAVSLSKDGSVLAVGAPGGSEEGQVMVYTFSEADNDWSLLGQRITNIDDSAVDEFGTSLALSEDGTTLVFGGPGFGSAKGRAMVYAYSQTNNRWDILGQEIQGESSNDRLGEVVQISGDGKTIALVSNITSSPAKGKVQTFAFKNNQWEFVGSSIEGENNNDLFGSDLSLSDNGNLLLVGAYGYPFTSGSKTLVGGGYAALYVLKDGQYTKQISLLGGGIQHFFGRSVSMSSDGTLFSVGSNGYDGYKMLNNGKVDIYHYNSTPLDLNLSTTTISENNAVGAIVGALSTQDPNTSDTFTYALVSGAGDTDNAAFSISGANLLAAASFDFETKSSYSILVQTTDAASNTLTKTFTIAVSDLDEDTDADGVPNSLDNCPSVANASQADADSDGIGDPCDNAPNVANPDQRDTDSDGIGDVIDTDKDGDGVPDTSDAFPLDPNENTDTDGDLIGDNADPDDDNDGILDPSDNCPLFSNTDQADIDADGIGDVCDTDNDNDGFTDAEEIACGSDPLNASDLPLDTDNDNLPDCFDEDDDNDGYLDASDAFPLDATEWTDTDADGTGNNADLDDDNDKQLDADEVSCGSDPLLASSSALDTDLDYIPNCVDPDDDNDGVLDGEDVFPLDSTEWTDTDADGIGDNADTDDDNDGYSDLDELSCNSDPLDRFKKPADQDNDGLADCVDEDRDGDGYQNNLDAFPDNSSEWKDADLDGFGDNFDPDDDNDGYLDASDAFPLDPTEWADADADGIGDNADPDDNNDGFTDEELFISGVITPNSASFESTWKIVNIERFPTHSIRVYNKSGQEVFSSTNYKNDWRGTLNNSGQLLPAGPYYYKISLNYSDQKSGWLYLTY